ncbi:MAG: hypothetical protein C0618_09145 [Desulfuromonas sp.]|nr:MAG: hypothetical protein C0618_09145 [Desulfuromonas sp.]
MTIALTSILITTVVANQNGPADITLQASMGDVSFDHAAHQQRITDCASCHHQGAATGCHSCHDGNSDAPKAKKIFHDNCKGCHSTMKAGPVKCRDCHQK